METGSLFDSDAFEGERKGQPERMVGGEANRLLPQDRIAHNWYRFVLSFPPHLVRDILQRFELNAAQCVLDPFCGTGTTVLECKRLGIPSIGIEPNPMAHFASRIKTDWSPDPEGLMEHACAVAEEATRLCEASGTAEDHFLCLERREAYPLRALPPEVASLLLTNSISPLPLHKTLILLDCLKARYDARYHAHELLALANALVTKIGNLHFGPEVGVGVPKEDAPVVSS